MRCPNCGGFEDTVLETRADADQVLIRRRRRCAGCDIRFTTYERADSSQYMVVKRNGRRERFDVKKLRLGIVRAVENLEIADSVIERLVNEVAADIRPEGQQITSQTIGQLIEDHLRHLDEVAFVRFASHFRRFSEASEFVQLVKELGDPKPSVVKRDGRWQPFDSGKILRGIAWAAKHTSIDKKQVQAIAEGVVKEVFANGHTEVHTREIGETVQRHLRERDHVAYIRFSSVFDRYEVAESFVTLASSIEPL